MNRLGIKVILTIAFIFISSIVLSAFEPVVSSNIAVNQLNDSYSSNAKMTIYQSIKPYTYIGYLALIVVVFYKDIKNLFKKK